MGLKSLVEELLEANRIQRHDFLNNIQVIWGLIKIDKPEKAIEYISEVTNYLHDLRKINQIVQPEIETMILSRVLEIGMNPGFDFWVSENWQVEDEQIYEINKLFTSIWKIIKIPLLEEKIKVELHLKENKIQINVNTNNIESSLNWNEVYLLCRQNNFQYKENKKEVIIKL